jgi:TolA-binding protein
MVEAFLSVVAEQENQPNPLVEAIAAGTSAQPTPVLGVLMDKEWQSVAHMREQMRAWREQLAELEQQQVALQQRIEALQQNQHYLAWQKQERERQRQELFPAASSNIREEIYFQ